MWNWELPEWPSFKFNAEPLREHERAFLLSLGSAFAHLKSIGPQELHKFVVEILSVEGLESSKIEGEFLDRESLQSSIQKHFGINGHRKKSGKKESGMASLLCNVYETFDKPLTHEMLYSWHCTLFKEDPDLTDCGKYRTHPEPMQIVSNRYGDTKIFFEAPPSSRVEQEMSTFINWYNRSDSSILTKAAVAHVYFESIHPFEDGNGRIGRILVEKILSKEIGKPVLIAVSRILEKNKKEYYAQLERCNRTLDVQSWIEFFANVIIEAQKDSMQLLNFLIHKSKILLLKLNPRQEKVLLRMFEEGPDGFKGGLTADKYIKIAQTTRATATRDLNELIELGALKKTGELRHTKYWLNIGEK